MKRRHFFKNTLLLGAGIATASNPSEILASSIISLTKKQQNKMKIVIMTGSPRQNGNTNYMAEQFIKGAMLTKSRIPFCSSTVVWPTAAISARQLFRR